MFLVIYSIIIFYPWKSGVCPYKNYFLFSWTILIHLDEYLIVLCVCWLSGYRSGWFQETCRGTRLRDCGPNNKPFQQCAQLITIMTYSHSRITVYLLKLPRLGTAFHCIESLKPASNTARSVFLTSICMLSVLCKAIACHNIFVSPQFYFCLDA